MMHVVSLTSGLNLQVLAQTAANLLATATWQGIALAAFVGLLLRVLPETSAGVRFAIWFAAFGAMAALPALNGMVHRFGQGSGRSLLTLDARWCVGIAALWVGASLWRAATLTVAAARLRGLWRRAIPVAGVQQDREAGGSRLAQICVSEEVDGPSVIGFWAPKILLPRWLLEQLSPDELRQVVLHESGHLGRADDWLNLLQKIALVVFPLNPALVWVERRLCLERELACDERVVRAVAGEQGGATAYASCLTRLAEFRIGRRDLGLALGALGRRSQLGRRVLQILANRRRMRTGQARLVMATALLGLIGGAVELERCPRLIGFADGTSQTAVLAAPTSPDGRTGQALFRAEMVSYQPQRLRRLQRRNDASPELEPNIGSDSAAPSSGAISLHEDSSTARTQPRRVLSQLGRARRSARTTRVVTVEWVSTTAYVAEQTAAQDGMAGLVPAEQIYPYAAVPTRDGWLLIEL